MSAHQGKFGQSPEEARISAERLRLALEAGRMGTWEWDIVGERVGWSPGLEAIHGLAAGTFPGTFDAYEKDIHPEDREYVRRAIEETLRDGDDPHLQYRIVLPDGRLRWVEGRGKLFRDEQGKPLRMIGVCADVTERAHAEQAQPRLAAIVESSDDAIIGQDMSGVITSWNRGAERLYRYRADEVLGKPVSVLIPPDHEDDFPTIMQRLRRGERIEHYETVRVARDGRRIDVSLTVSPIRNARGEIVGASKIARDIGERKRAEQSLRARALQQQAVAKLGGFALSEQDLQRVLERAVETLAETLQIECCKVLELLPEGKELLLRAGVGWRAGLVGTARVGTGLDSQAGYTLQSDAAVIVTDLREEQRFRGPSLLVEHGVVSGMSCVIRGSAGKPWGVLGCHSKRRVAFTEDDVNFLASIANILSHAIHRDRVDQALREADRRKDEFIAMLSHELRNPLAPIRSALELLRMNDVGIDPAQIHEIIERQTNHLVRLVDDLLEISRVERGILELRRERLSLSEVLSSAVETSTPLIDEAGHLLQVDLPRQPVWIEGDRMRLAQVFANLLNNSARFTRRGGRITLAVSREDGQAVVAVRDTGIGFSLHAREHLFEMFNRGAQSSGLGIGLALARRLVEMHGGTIDAKSEGEGKGAEFVVRLPMVESPAAEPQPAAGEERRGKREAGYRVLVADDNRDAAESLGLLLRLLGNDVMLAFDGEEAVRVARAFQPQVVLLDVGMPKLDGYGAARAIREDLRNVRLIALTGWGQDSDRRRAREAGFDAHLVKPAEIETLRSVLAGQGGIA